MIIQPKKRNAVKVPYQVAKRSRAALTLLAKYSERSEGEIIDLMVEQVLKDDTDFLLWVKEQRYKAKAEQYDLLENLSLLDDEQGENMSIMNG